MAIRPHLVSMENKSHFIQRQSMRQSILDYSVGFFFITICTDRRRCYLCRIRNDEVAHSWIGQIVEEELKKSTLIRSELILDKYVIMPNHLHMILGMNRDIPFGSIKSFTSPAKNFGAFIRTLKAVTTRQIRERIGKSDFILWQRNFYDHSIRNEDDYRKTIQYIDLNPSRWSCDRENPVLIGRE